MTPFLKRHLGVDEVNQQSQLALLGYETMDAFLADLLPESVAHPPGLDWEGVDESTLLADLEALANQNQVQACYLGQGYVPCHTPAVIQRHFLQNPGWYTQYTPYQAEVAQGRLALLFYFQTMISELTALPLANASLLDEATAAAEAMLLLYHHRNKRRVEANIFWVEAACNPQTLAVVRTRARALGIEVRVAPRDAIALDEHSFGVLLAYPDAAGLVHDHHDWIRQAHAKQVKVVMCCDVLALTVLTPPGELGADIACGSCQRFGVPMGYGGPHAAYFAVSQELKRMMPGRVVGVTRDANGDPAYRLALQTREQHIRREKATSNICTAQALLAMASTLYAVHHGPDGLKTMALRIHDQTRRLAQALQASGATLAGEAYFDTLLFQLPGSSEAVQQRARDAGIQIAQVGKQWRVTLSEMTTESDLQALWDVLCPRDGTALAAPGDDMATSIWPSACQRDSDYLRDDVFHQYHAETALMRWLHQLRQKDLSLVDAMTPLGSCTMKLNPAVSLLPWSWPTLHALHPMAPRETVEGMHTMIDRLAVYLQKITGFAGTSFQPNSGAQGEYAGLMTINAYHRARGESRDIALVPSSAHGTNPASAVMAGLKVVVVRCGADGEMDLEDLQKQCDAHAERVACLMVTYPSTFGVYDEHVVQMCDMVHAVGGQVYLDGANMNAQLGLTTPAAVGADVCHLNLHKTFCIPHGGGGPGMGPICVAAHLVPHLPKNPFDVVVSDEAEHDAVSAAPYGSASILLISYAYIALMGGQGLRACAAQAMLHANYMAKRLSGHYPIVYRGKSGLVAHEFIIDCRALPHGIKAIDIAKRLMDYGLHAPTLSWPVPDTLMIEPTESESLEACDRYCDALIQIRKEIDAITDPDHNVLRHAPHTLACVTADAWDYPYTRSEAAWPQGHLRAGKCWPSVRRVDDVYGDRHLVCSCADMASYETS